MAKDIIIAILVAIILSAMIVLSGCLPTAGKMKTGEIVKPPSGWTDWKNRTELVD